MGGVAPAWTLLQPLSLTPVTMLEVSPVLGTLWSGPQGSCTQELSGGQGTVRCCHVR